MGLLVAHNDFLELIRSAVRGIVVYDMLGDVDQRFTPVSTQLDCPQRMSRV